MITEIDLELGVIGSVRAVVDFSYAKGSPARLYGDPSSCRPETPCEFEINSLKYNGVDLWPIFQSDRLYYAVKEYVMGGM